ncbi:hypothetical protein [Spongorhabdus nitratireducens]
MSIDSSNHSESGHAESRHSDPTKKRRRRRRSSRSNKKSFDIKPSRALFALAGIALLFQASQTSLALIKAGALNSQTNQYLEYWQGKEKKDPQGFQPKPHDYEVALKGAERALETLPDSPEQWVLKARVLEWGQRYNLEPKVDDLQQSPLLTSWETAIQLRPAWPYAWADYAMDRAQYSLIDDKFTAALMRANELGPWELRVQQLSATLGLHYKGFLAPELQHTLDASLQRYEKLDPRAAKKLIEQYTK